jgi:hypothetical protein
MPLEFWEEESRDDRRLWLSQIPKWALVFAALFAFVFFAFWWAGSAIHFGASRVTASTEATWTVSGTVKSAVSGAAVPWAEVEDDPSGPPPLHKTTADPRGSFALTTISEPHWVSVHAPGFRPINIKVGRVWYLWMPRGQENLDVSLRPE